MDSASAWTALLALGEHAGDETDDDAAADLVHLLAQRGEPVVLGWALAALADPDPWHRQASAWVLGELGYEDGRPFGDQVVPALVEAARVERDDETRQLLVSALGHAGDPAWVRELLTYADDPYPPVREAVAGALPSMVGDDDLSAQAVTTLIRLTSDVDPGVRDWATFALGTQSSLDSEEIRDALAARLDDEGGDTRFEAALGLARRGDDRVLADLQRRLDDATATIYLLDLATAAELADPALLPALGRWSVEWAGDEDEHTRALAYAIERCAPETHVAAAAAQPALVDAVNRALSDIGWGVVLDGDYPRTVVSVRRPDGAVDRAHGRSRLWEDISPTGFDVAREATSWADAIRAIAAAESA
ncbi:HEAT repeat domain-containing protein [Cellulomonas citrea]|uniref:HEAT repeat domain-containing protein n=1 Tax=Cellulomonas citrea TaxID=1909423 RepID=UPI0013584561|nr:HEAT repeat domain-containing protein [Cellulomonas citrea]